MKTTKYLLFTMKEKPINIENDSHTLMLRAGLIRQLSSGIYIWLPTGIKVLNKIIKIIHTEIQKIGGIEIYMPAIQPANLWHESKRWTTYGNELFKLCDRKNHQFVLAPTHEEIVTYLIKNEIHSYKQLPILLYQIQNKFRDEIRPRSGVIRSREFIMKDAYSFHLNKLSLTKMYHIMHETYIKIFDKLKLQYRSVKADSNIMGGEISHEFQAFSKNGEDTIMYSQESNYTENININPSITQSLLKNIIQKNQKNIISTINQLYLNKIIKIILLKAKENQLKDKFIAVAIKNNHIINFKQLEKIDIIINPLEYASKDEQNEFIKNQKQDLKKTLNNIFLITDLSVINSLKNINWIKINEHLININEIWKNFFKESQILDISKNIDTNFDKNIFNEKKEILKIQQCIEIGHIFQLENKYSSIFKANIQNKRGENKNLSMGCYGIGITRIVAAIIEQNNDNKGIIWPNLIAPFQIAIIPINLYKSKIVQKISESLYQTLINNKIDVLFNDKNEQIGIIFSQMDLIGIPHQLIISETNLKNNNIEYHYRNSTIKNMININDINNFIKEIL
ncbi:Proline--tRNA ligase [Buchnera aphidicola (Eriosoma grossulariae)]|uniref:proline--tRNA ligase n=1 Tax=Buchnera aphidicola TaxID=9 RepID=UPI0034642958